jgi:hypothetical protein
LIKNGFKIPDKNGQEYHLTVVLILIRHHAHTGTPNRAAFPV